MSYPLTRLEMTVDPAIPYSKINFPTVYFLRDLQMSLDEIRATDTERFILSVLLQGYGSLTDLGRKTREKIKRIMEHYISYIHISEIDFNSILWQLHSFTNGQLETDKTDPDQPPPQQPQLPDWVMEIEKDGGEVSGL